MTLKECRKALVAFASATITAYVAAWTQTEGGMPGWSTAGACALMGVVAGLTVFGVRNASPSAPYVPVPGSPVATMATRAAARKSP